MASDKETSLCAQAAEPVEQSIIDLDDSVLPSFA